jgi:formate/nitrite transporter FocA (FNT family)
MFFLALAYPLGFIFVVIGKSELFTEHTTLAVIPVLNKNAGIRSLLTLWIVVYAGNLLGGFFFSWILSILPAKLDIVENASFLALAQKINQSLLAGNIRKRNSGGMADGFIIMVGNIFTGNY